MTDKLDRFKGKFISGNPKKITPDKNKPSFPYDNNKVHIGNSVNGRILPKQGAI